VISQNFGVKYTTSGIITLSWEQSGRILGHKVGYFFFFADFLRKNGQKHSSQFLKLSMQNLENPSLYLNSPKKIASDKKQSIQNGVGEVEILLI